MTILGKEKWEKERERVLNVCVSMFMYLEEIMIGDYTLWTSEECSPTLT